MPNPRNPYSDSLLADALLGSLSNAESLARGFAVAPVGLLGDINALGREYITPRLPRQIQSLLETAPSAPTTEQILANIPRASQRRMETSGMEQLGAAMNPMGPIELAGAAERGAMAAGRAGERYAEKVVPQIMERGGLPAQLLGDLSQGSIRQVIEKNPAPFIVKHGTNQPFDEFKSGMGVTAKHIYTTPEEYAQDAAKYGDTLITAQASPKSLIDFSSEGKLDKQTISALKKAAKDAGITDKYYPFESFIDDVMSGQLYQKGGGSRDQDALLSELFSKYQAVKMPDATSGGGISKSVVFEDPSVLKVLKDEGLLGQSKAAEATDLLSYRGSHTAPSPEFGAPLHDLTGGGQMYPADVYSPKAAQYYGTGYPKADKEAFALANKVRGNPEAEVTMYRAVPKNESIKDINAGDWVTLSKDYAKNHGEAVLDNDYKIISKKVKAKDLWTNADSIHEFGYWPE